MTALWQQPAYIALAREAARELGADNVPTIEAILAQWTCEQPAPAPWPPVHDNPGNLTTAIGNLDGTPHSVARTAPGAGLLYVYGSPDNGALAYARYLLNSSRYRPAVNWARAGNGRAFLAGVINAGYGTRASCALGVLGSIHLPVAPPPAPGWVCLAPVVNERTGPGTRYPVIGSVREGQHVTGIVVSGGQYRAGGKVYSSWLRLAVNRYAARVFFRLG